MKKRLIPIGGIELGLAGSVIGFGVNFPDLYRRAAHIVDKVLKGAKPADLPIERATRFELMVNVKSATALGLEIPKSVLFRADRIIE
jgi:putative ABC transport system substrate-binding protein